MDSGNLLHKDVESFLRQCAEFGNRRAKLTPEQTRRAEALLLRIRGAGEKVRKPLDRNTLASLAQNLGEAIFESTGRYPSVRLADPPAEGETSTFPDRTVRYDSSQDLLERQTTAVQPWSQIELLLQNKEVDRALIKLAGIAGCADEANSLLCRFQFLQDQLRLGTYTRQQVAEETAEIIAAARRVLEEAPYIP